MKIFKVGPTFYIFFTAVTMLPAIWLAGILQDLLENWSGTFLQTLAQSRIIEAPSTIVIIFLFFWVYETFFWRVWPFNILHGVPYISGRYEGTVESSYDNKQYPVRVEVRQTLTNVTVCLYTERSSSYSIMANVGKNDHGNNFLAYVYKNTPRTVTNNLDMRAHDGFASLDIFTREKRLDGYYHNDPRNRPTHGHLVATRVSRKTLGHF